MTTTPCNRDLIAEQMSALGLSERTLVSRIQFPLFAFRKARIQGVLDRHITLGQVQKLCTALGISPADLLDVDEPLPPVRHTRDASGDAQLLIPLLVGLPRRVSVPFLVRTLGWERSRTTDAIRAIPAALEGTGLVLHAEEDKIAILPARRNTGDIRRALATVQTKSRGLTVAQASTLKRVVDGKHSTQRNIGNAERVILGALKNMGCIELNDKAGWRATEDLHAAIPDMH